MDKSTKIKYSTSIKIQPENVFFFDMDGTLIETDFANYLSYKRAIETVMKVDNDFFCTPHKRFNRGNLKTSFPNLTDCEYDSIIQKKEENYQEYLSYTKLNQSLVDILTKYAKTNKTVLVTNCRQDRALMTLNYHNLTEKFSNLFFRKLSQDSQKINKFHNAIMSLGVNPNTVIVYENEENEVLDAVSAGIKYINPIIKI
jgi:beta-phosphoglucomutase